MVMGSIREAIRQSISSWLGAAEAEMAPAGHSAECMMAPFAVQLHTMQGIRRGMLNTEVIVLDLVDHLVRPSGPLGEQ